MPDQRLVTSGWLETELEIKLETELKTKLGTA